MPLLAFVLLLAAPGVADEEETSEWEAAKAWLFASDRIGPLDAKALVAFSAHLRSLSPDALDARTETREVWQMPDERRVPLQHALRSLAWLRRLGPHLERGPEVAVLLGEREGRAWERALVELCREPFGERLGRAARILSRSEHGAMRVMSGVLAKYLNAYCGGQGSEWGKNRKTEWDPTPLVREIAARLLDDPNPAVTCRFVTYDAYGLYDPWIVDEVVSRLKDARQMPRVHRGLLAGRERTVGATCALTLHAQFDFRRRPFPNLRDSPPDPRDRMPTPWRVTEFPAAETPKALDAFWRQVRDRWSFVPDGEAWREMLDETLTLVPGRKSTFTTPFGPLSLSLRTYAEGFDTLEGPVLTIHVDVAHRDSGASWTMGNPTHHIGFLGGGSGTGPGWRKNSLLYAPRNEKGVRMRVGIWTTLEPASKPSDPDTER